MLAGFSVFADDLYVNSSGLEGTYYTIQEAVDAANAGDNIYIATVGTYSEDVVVDKTLFLIAAVPDELFTLSGEIQFNCPNGSEVTIIGLNNGSVGANITGDDDIKINIISSLVSAINFGAYSGYEVNVYNSTVYNAFTIKNGQVKGNIINTLNVSDDALTDNDTIKIMGNYMKDLDYSNDSHYFEICNNFIDGSSQPSDLPFSITDWRTTSGGTNLISNNTITFYEVNSYSSAYGIYFSNNSDGQNLVIANNYIECTYESYSTTGYAIYSTWAISNAYVANNYYAANTETSNFETSSIIDNVSANYNYDASSGIVSGGENMGLDWIEYRDIDNSINDIGPAGGPHAWSNYNTTQGKAAIFDLELPFQLYIGGIHNVKAKSFHKN